MNRWRLGVIGGIVTLVAVVYLIANINAEELLRALREARYEFIAPSAGLLVIGLVTRALRWQVLLGRGLPLRRAFSIMNIAYLVNGVLPFRIGEVARMFLVHRAEPSSSVVHTAGSIVVERLLDLLAIAVMVFLALLFGPVPVELRTAALAALPLVFVGFAVLVALPRRRAMVQGIIKHGIGRLTPRGATRLAALADHILEQLTPLTAVRPLLLALFWTVVSWGFSIAAGAILMLTFYEQASLPATLLYIAAAALVIAVPALPGSLGPYEASIVFALSAYGLAEPTARAAAFALLVHGLNLFIHSVTGAIGFLQEGVSWQQLSRGVETIQQPSLDPERSA